MIKSRASSLLFIALFFFFFFFQYPPKWCTWALLGCVTRLVSRETAAVSARSVYIIIQPCTMSRHFMQSYIRRMPACLAVTFHLHCRQNDRDLLCATAVTRGWNGYRNESIQKVDPGEGNSPAAPAGTRTRDLLITRPVL